MYDVTREESFQDLGKWLLEIRRYSENAVIMLVGNKIDLPREFRRISRRQGSEFAYQNKLLFMETSCLPDSAINCSLSSQILLQGVYQKNPIVEVTSGYSTSKSPTISVEANGDQSKSGGGCFGINNKVNTKGGIKSIGELTYDDLVETPRGFSNILYLKSVEGVRQCVAVDKCVVTPYHLIYTKNGDLEKASISGTVVANPMVVRGVIVSGDSFYCENVLVSSQTHCKEMVYLSPLLDYTPTLFISLWDSYLCPIIEPHFET
jgi:hypothetical protein